MVAFRIITDATGPCRRAARPGAAGLTIAAAPARPLSVPPVRGISGRDRPSESVQRSRPTGFRDGSPRTAVGDLAGAGSCSNAAWRSGRTSHRKRVFDSVNSRATMRGAFADCVQRHVERHSRRRRLGPARRRRPFRPRRRPARLRSGRGSRGPGRPRSPGACAAKICLAMCGVDPRHLAAVEPVNQREVRAAQFVAGDADLVEQVAGLASGPSSRTGCTSSTWPRALISSDGGMAIVCLPRRVRDS